MPAKLEVEIHPDLSGVDPVAWDRIAGDRDPFVEHAFLRLLEDSGCVGEGTGWRPMHVTVKQEGKLIGALPLYAKMHSYGEYIFDWAWANAAERMGLSYYPKLVSMVPVTPATGQRILLDPEEDAERVTEAMLAGVFAAADGIDASSVHLNFLTETECALLPPKLSLRKSMQFHWDNDDYESFESYLSRFRSSPRKQVKKERRKVQESGLRVQLLDGASMNDQVWEAVSRFYLDTCRRKGSHPYLTPEFFSLVRERIPHRTLAAVAFDEKRPVAVSLNFQKGPNLYGRYWGAEADYDSLHFELCYYRLIEHAIDNKMEHFEAGAQGMHKLKRGLVPVTTHSAHWVRNPALSRAVVDFLERESKGVDHDIEVIMEQSPFHREHQDTP